LNAFLLRLLDIVISAAGLILLCPVLLILLVIGFFDTGAPLYRQIRVGRHQRPFTLVKLRTMALDTPQVGTHLVSPDAVTPFGAFLRRTKLDELPQLWNVFKGDMSLVGPRPCLPTQHEVIAARAQHAVFHARPGITGLAQVSDVDMSTPALLAQMDERMLSNLNVFSYVRFIVMTLLGNGAGDRVNAKL
jgi:lipopolysaccharide/colanic/teichoic acid biosynthesis glycosyltransferase